jgi:outer membrane protein assembly factor BamB
VRYHMLRFHLPTHGWVTRVAIRLVIAAAATFSGLFVLAPPVSASPLGAPATSTSASPQTGAPNVLSINAPYIYPGATVLLEGMRFSTLEEVTIYFDGTPIGATMVKPMGINGPLGGRILTALTIPSTTTPGLHTISVLGELSNVTSQITFTVEGNWPEFNYIPAGDRYNPYETTINTSNVSSLAVAWAGFQASFGMYASPIVVNGVVYSLSDDDGHFQAFDEATGKTLWSYLSVNPTTAAAYKDGVLYFGTIYGTVNAFSAATGAFLWTSPYPNGTACFFDASPTVVGDLVYFGDTCGNESAFTTGSCSMTCNPVWQTTLPGQINVSSPAVVNGDLYVGTSAGEIAVLNATTGALLYTDTTGSSYGTPVMVANGIAYIGTSVGGSSGQLEAFDATGCGAATCNPLWSSQTVGAIASSPAVENGVVYVTSEDGNLYAFGASGCGQSTCSSLWTAVAGAATGEKIYSSPAIANGVVYVDSTVVSSEGGHIYAFDANGCGAAICSTPLWSYDAKSQVWSSPLVVNGTLYVGTRSSGLLAFRPTTATAKKPPVQTFATAPSIQPIQRGTANDSRPTAYCREQNKALSTSSPWPCAGPAMPGASWLR